MEGAGVRGSTAALWRSACPRSLPRSTWCRRSRWTVSALGLRAGRSASAVPRPGPLRRSALHRGAERPCRSRRRARGVDPEQPGMAVSRHRSPGCIETTAPRAALLPLCAARGRSAYQQAGGIRSARVRPQSTRRCATGWATSRARSRSPGGARRCVASGATYDRGKFDVTC